MVLYRKLDKYICKCCDHNELTVENPKQRYEQISRQKVMLVKKN